MKTGEQLVLHLVAPTKQEKAAWVTDIAQVTPLFPDTVLLWKIFLLISIIIENKYKNNLKIFLKKRNLNIP